MPIAVGKTTLAAMEHTIEPDRVHQGWERAREAYVLCSLAGDLKIMEIVDSGAWNVGFTMPLSILSTPGR